MGRTPKSQEHLLDTPQFHQALKPYFGYCLYKAALILRSQINEALADHGIIVTQLGILRLLAEIGPLSQIGLGQEMGIDKASMVKFIDGLETKKLVTRSGCTQDRRVKFIEITKQGRKLLEKGSQLRVRAEEEFLSPLTGPERAILQIAIPKLLR